VSARCASGNSETGVCGGLVGNLRKDAGLTLRKGSVKLYSVSEAQPNTKELGN